MMTSMSYGIPSQNTTIWNPPLAAQSSRRGPYCRLNNSCRRPTKTRRLRHNTNRCCPRPLNKGTRIPLYCSCPLGCYYNGYCLLTTNRSQVPNRLFLSRTHRPCRSRYPDPNPMGLRWSAHSYDRSWTYLIRSFLSSKYQL